MQTGERRSAGFQIVGLQNHHLFAFAIADYAHSSEERLNGCQHESSSEYQWKSDAIWCGLGWRSLSFTREAAIPWVSPLERLLFIILLSLYDFCPFQLRPLPSIGLLRIKKKKLGLKNSSTKVSPGPLWTCLRSWEGQLSCRNYSYITSCVVLTQKRRDWSTRDLRIDCLIRKVCKFHFSTSMQHSTFGARIQAFETHKAFANESD